MQDFPKWKYSKDGLSKLINSVEEEKELGSDWRNSPADFDDEDIDLTEDLEGLTVAKLRDLAKTAKIEGYKKLSKEKLIEALK